MDLIYKMSNLSNGLKCNVLIPKALQCLLVSVKSTLHPPWYHESDKIYDAKEGFLLLYGYIPFL